MSKEMDKIQLGKISVQMGDKTVNLTVEQARELCALLKGLFGDDSTKMVHTHDYIYPRPWYAGPYWTYSGSNWNMSVTDSNNGVLNGNSYQGTYTLNLYSTTSKICE